jgi:uncharacterized phiE125 gp8 family phage protein
MALNFSPHLPPALYQTSASPPDITPLSLEEVKAHLRITLSDEDALIAGLIRAASDMAERFIGHALIQRDCSDILPTRGDWQKLAQSPVQSIMLVEGIPAEGAIFALPAADYAVDIDAGGTGWVRVLNKGSAGRMRVSYRAGLAANPNAVPEAIRLGLLHMTAHLFANRDNVAEPPAAIVALWRPYRRMRLI